MHRTVVSALLAGLLVLVVPAFGQGQEFPVRDAELQQRCAAYVTNETNGLFARADCRSLLDVAGVTFINDMTPNVTFRENVTVIGGNATGQAVRSGLMRTRFRHLPSSPSTAPISYGGLRIFQESDLDERMHRSIQTLEKNLRRSRLIANLTGALSTSELDSICGNTCIADFNAAWLRLYQGNVDEDNPGTECLRANGTALLANAESDRRMRQFIALGPLMQFACQVNPRTQEFCYTNLVPSLAAFDQQLDANRSQCNSIYELSCCSRGAQQLAFQSLQLNRTFVAGLPDNQRLSDRLEQCELSRQPVCVRPGVASQVVNAKLALRGLSFAYYQANPVQVELVFRRDLAALLNRETENTDIDPQNILITGVSGAPANASAADQGGNVTIFNYIIRRDGLSNVTELQQVQQRVASNQIDRFDWDNLRQLPAESRTSDTFQIIESLSGGTVDQNPGEPENPNPPIDASAAFGLHSQHTASLGVMLFTALAGTLALALQMHS